MPAKTASIWTDGENHLKNSDPLFNQLIKDYGPCTLLPIAEDDYYITLLKGILAQQVANDVSQKLFASFTECFGTHPDPEKIASSSYAELKACGVPDLKVQYIKDLSQHVLSGKINLSGFKDMDDNSIIRQLTEVRGLGRWTAELFLILGLCRPDVLPAEDFGLKKSMSLLLKLPQVPQKRSQVTELTEPWKPWRSLATWYMWQYFADTSNKV